MNGKCLENWRSVYITRLDSQSIGAYFKEEAEEAFHACLDTGFSAKAWRNLLPIYESRHQTSQVLTAIAKLTAWNLRWYSEVRALQFVLMIVLS
jgi:hypothetical protein